MSIKKFLRFFSFLLATLSKVAFFLSEEWGVSHSLIKKAGQNMSDELAGKGLYTTFPCIEIYGHWTNDETKLETELLMSLK